MDGTTDDGARRAAGRVRALKAGIAAASVLGLVAFVGVTAARSGDGSGGTPAVEATAPVTGAPADEGTTTDEGPFFGPGTAEPPVGGSGAS